MRKQQIRISVFAALILAVIATLIWSNRPSTEKVQQIATAPTVANPVLAAKVAEPVVADKAEPAKVVKMESALTPPEKKQLAEQLELFRELDVKVLMNPKEKERYVAILKDPKIQSLVRKAILRADKENRQIQDRSVEFLVSAIKSDVNVSAIMKDIISDATIESESVAQDARQVQAELKAELLYSWTSHNPNEIAGVAGLLPGPVSQRIWNNIVHAQNNNVEESLTVQ